MDEKIADTQLISQVEPLDVWVVDSDIDDLGYFVAVDVKIPEGEDSGDYTFYPTADITAELVEALLKANRLAAEKNATMEGLGEDAIAKCDRVFGLSDEEISLLLDALSLWRQDVESTGFTNALIAKLEASKGR